MKNGIIAKGAVILVGCGLLMPPSAGLAADPTAVQATHSVNSSPLKDIELDATGSLHGAAIDQQGRPMVDVPVALLRDGRVVAEAKSDSNGRFAMKGLRGGVYQVASKQNSALMRVWSAGTAPPAAAKAVLLLPEQDVVRGQQRIPDLFRSNAFIVGSIIVAAVAIPVIVHNSRDDSSDNEDDSSS